MSDKDPEWKESTVKDFLGLTWWGNLYVEIKLKLHNLVKRIKGE